MLRKRNKLDFNTSGGDRQRSRTYAEGVVGVVASLMGVERLGVGMPGLGCAGIISAWRCNKGSKDEMVRRVDLPPKAT